MLVKLDENLGNTHADFIRELGYDCDRVTDEGLSGASDRTVWEKVIAEGRFFITLDLDFSDIRKFSPGSHPGILLLRPRSRSRQAALDLLKRVLSENSLENMQGCLVVADEYQTRIRRPI